MRVVSAPEFPRARLLVLAVVVAPPIRSLPLFWSKVVEKELVGMTANLGRLARQIWRRSALELACDASNDVFDVCEETCCASLLVR